MAAFGRVEAACGDWKIMCSLEGYPPTEDIVRLFSWGGRKYGTTGPRDCKNWVNLLNRSARHCGMSPLIADYYPAVTEPHTIERSRS